MRIQQSLNINQIVVFEKTKQDGTEWTERLTGI